MKEKTIKIFIAVVIIVVGVSTAKICIALPEPELIYPEAKETLKANIELTNARPVLSKVWENLFSDDFEGELAPSWNFSGSWLVQNEASKVLEISSELPFNTSFGSETWTDYREFLQKKGLLHD